MKVQNAVPQGSGGRQWAGGSISQPPKRLVCRALSGHFCARHTCNPGESQPLNTMPLEPRGT